MAQLAPDLGAYILPGKVTGPKAGLTQAAEGERIGLGTVWLSERWETKEVGALLGAVSQVTRAVKLGTATTHFVTRSPLVLAGMAATLQGLSDNRLILGFGRSLDWRWKNVGLPIQTLRVMTDYVGILRRLWAGEEVSYEGPAGHFPKLQMADVPEKAPPLMLAAMGTKTLELAGRLFDGVLLHPFLTVEGMRRCADIVREAAVGAGRKAEDVTIYGSVVMAPDMTAEQSAYTIKGRASSYLIHSAISKWLIEFNEWDPAPVEALGKLGLEDIESQKLDVEEVQRRLIEAGKRIPDEWVHTGAAAGTAAYCAERLKAYRAAGADEIVMHGATTDKLEAVIKAYAAL